MYGLRFDFESFNVLMFDVHFFAFEILIMFLWVLDVSLRLLDGLSLSWFCVWSDFVYCIFFIFHYVLLS